MRWIKLRSFVVLSILCASLAQAQEKSDVELPLENDDVQSQPVVHQDVPEPVEKEASPVIRADEKSIPFPIVLPAFNQSRPAEASTSHCLLYLESMNIFVWKVDPVTFRHAVIGNVSSYNPVMSADTYHYSADMVKCDLTNRTVGEATFKIAVTPAEDVHDVYDSFSIAKGRIEFTLTFTGFARGYWGLTSIRVDKGFSITPKANTNFLSRTLVLTDGAILNDTKNMDNLGVQSWAQYGYACSQTPVAFFDFASFGEAKDYTIGIGFGNMQVDLKAFLDPKDNIIKFNRDMSDCVGTFSPGSLMGIVCSLVLASILMFGYLMLQSVQTMDRFDDPKQKQIVINYKE